MINFSFGLSNPYSNKFKTICSKINTIKNKEIEFELLKTNDIISFGFTLTTRCHHAGVYLDFGLLGYTISIKCLDVRHWDEANNKYEEIKD